MSKKQKRVLYRLILAAVLLVAASLLPVTGVWKFLCFLVPYFIIGYDVLLGALHGIVNGQIFDENFLMAIATVGAMGVGDYKESVAVLLFYQLGELCRGQEPSEHYPADGHPSGVRQRDR